MLMIDIIDNCALEKYHNFSTGNYEIHSLAYADAIIQFSDSVVALQHKINDLWSQLDHNHLLINLRKTNAVFFLGKVER